MRNWSAKIETAPFLVGGDVLPIGHFEFVLQSVDEPTLIDEEPGFAGTHRLGSAYPSPFATEAAFTLAVRRSQPVRIDLYDLTGRRVRTLFDGFVQAGSPHRVTIRAGDLPSGVYLYRAAGQDFKGSRTVVLMR